MSEQSKHAALIVESQNFVWDEARKRVRSHGYRGFSSLASAIDV